MTYSEYVYSLTDLTFFFFFFFLNSVNLIDKETLNAEDFSYSGSHVACKARAAAFIGVTMALGALGGSFVSLS
jgi:hypothetical protein